MPFDFKFERYYNLCACFRFFRTANNFGQKKKEDEDQCCYYETDPTIVQKKGFDEKVLILETETTHTVDTAVNSSLTSPYSYNLTMQKLTGNYRPAKKVACLITLSSSSLAAANAARQKRQKFRKYHL